ncbi:Sybindin-like protein [Parasponia andersonii]|uniref:Sybindin-like protein n=1 Tax=Parasponia andersonii TaxID=3476 RepID=A0A2P5BT81_PARAD|nr:Sybindin-like protein [Parasponia andersonii]
MGQQSLIYSFVARGTVILAEYTEFTGNFTSIASQCLQKLPATNNKFTYNCDGHTFNYLVDDGFTYYVVAVEAVGRQIPIAFLERIKPACSFNATAYCVVAVEAVGRQIPIAFLERIKEDFTKRYGGGKAATAVANSLNKEFGPKLKEHMQYCMDHPEEINKLAKVKAQVSEVKGVMMENIEKVLDRGEKIELLVDKTENLRSQVSFTFIKSCTGLQAAGNPDEEEDVVAEHEDKANSFGYLNCADSHNCSICLWRLQLLMGPHDEDWSSSYSSMLPVRLPFFGLLFHF